MRATFSEESQAAYDRAIKESAPWVPSLAQIEAQCRPLVDRMRDMGEVAVRGWVKESYAMNGLMPRIVEMYKKAE